MLPKYVVMIVNEVNFIFVHLNLMNVWLCKHCCTYGEQGWKSHGKKDLCGVLIDREYVYRGGELMDGGSGVFGVRMKCLTSSTLVLALFSVELNEDDSNS